ncbi:type II secretion system protein GspD [Thermosipho atlanticus]|uniref:Secretin and TonB N terminus short domain-containing protein n=1 Tax=Thermosipho atlanticus DSM 15807 TaxID=1123380 RepID=A0A1M5U6B3_9BACT|nr:secretin and TonB N-terminal domain-containing protein [Thermosipho atlanticus]SHH58478.1 Secretin and TonB N terminus short domain-containing protein [Thermosipho atlanticus DSM 15807]
MRKFLIIIYFLLVISFVFSVDVYFYQTDIRDALSQISMQEGVSILYDPLVSGFITVEVYDVSLEKALDLMLLPLGYYWTKVDNVYFVGVADPDSSGFGLISEKYLINLYNITYDNVVNALPKIFGNYIYRTPNINQVLIYAPPKIASQIAETITYIDIPVYTAEVEVKIIEVDEKDFEKFGINWAISSEGGQGFDFNYSPNGLQAIINPLSYELSFLLDSLIRSGNAKILGQGTLLVKSGNVSRISGYTTIGLKLVDANNNYVEKRLTTEVILTGYVFLKHISLNVRTIVESVMNDGINDNPVGSLLETSVDVKYQEPYYIAGLSFETVLKTNIGIPGLKDVPIIGKLFYQTKYETHKKNVIIVIQAKLVGERK